MKNIIAYQLLALVVLVSPCLAASEQSASYPIEAAKFRDRGQDLYLQGQEQDAIAEYSRAIEISPDAAVYFSRALAWWNLENIDHAIDDFSRAIELDSQLVRAYAFRGACYARKNDPNRAIADLTFALEKLPSNDTFHLIRANVWQDLQNYEIAINDLDEAIRWNSENPQLYFSRGVCWRNLEQWNKAKDDIDRALKLNPQYQSCYLVRGEIHLGLEQYANAKEDYERAIELDDQDLTAMGALANFLGTCPNKEFRDYPVAIKLAKKLCELTEHKELGFLELLAKIYAESGNQEEAIKWQSRALKLASVDDKDGVREELESYEALKSTTARR